MNLDNRAIEIKGIGHVSNAGYSFENLRKKMEAHSQPIEDNYAGYGTFNAPEIDPSRLGVARKEQRFLGPLMKLATAASYEALDNANLLENADTLAELDLIVACGAGVRNEDQDLKMVNETYDIAGHEQAVEGLLQTQLRPTEFLCQLPNLTAANICMFFGLKGSTRTLMGGESAGVHALKMAVNKIQSGKADRVLVGGASFGQCFYSNLALAQAGLLKKMNDGSDKLALGSAATFLLLETVNTNPSLQKKNTITLRNVKVGHKDTLNIAQEALASSFGSKFTHITVVDQSAEQIDGYHVQPFNSMTGNTREEAIFGGIAAACAAMINDKSGKGFLTLKHEKAGCSLIELERVLS